MKEQPFSSVSRRPDCSFFEISDVSFLNNGPYSFSLAKGECLGMTGQSGIGKSQLLRAIVDLIPHSGEVCLDGIAASDFMAPEWRKMVGFVAADSAWWYDMVGDHFHDCSESNLFRSILSRLSFDETVLGWESSRLSTGERQRLALLRALVLEPKVLLLDEPTASLDSHHVDVVEHLIAELQREKDLAVVWVSHDRSQLDRVATMSLRVEQSCLSKLSS